MCIISVHCLPAAATAHFRTMLLRRPRCSNGLTASHPVLCLKHGLRLAMVVHICNASIQEAEAGGSRLTEGQSGLHSEFQVSQRVVSGTLS